MSARFTTRLIDRSEDNTEDWLKRKFQNILAQDSLLEVVARC